MTSHRHGRENRFQAYKQFSISQSNTGNVLRTISRKMNKYMCKKSRIL